PLSLLSLPVPCCNSLPPCSVAMPSSLLAGASLCTSVVCVTSGDLCFKPR
ncbi:unnamed protein product, partial [Closterium sp. Yama58-4]